jgi:hypothetical protein
MSGTVTPTISFQQLSYLRVAALEMAAKIPVAIVGLVTTAGACAIWNYKPVSAKRRDCLAGLAANPEVSTEMLMGLLDSRDPAALIHQHLRDARTSQELAMALRTALAKLL